MKESSALRNTLRPITHQQSRAVLDVERNDCRKSCGGGISPAWELTFGGEGRCSSYTDKTASTSYSISRSRNGDSTTRPEVTGSKIPVTRTSSDCPLRSRDSTSHRGTAVAIKGQSFNRGAWVEYLFCFKFTHN